MATGVLPEVETRQLEVMMKDGDKIITQEEFCKITLSVYFGNNKICFQSRFVA